MSDKHTPGPWHASRTHNGAAFDIGAGNGSNIALVRDADETPANACAIAALPDLLDALKHLRHDIGDLIANSGGVYGLHLNGDRAPWSELTEDGRFCEWLQPALDAADAAIAKATGAA